MDFDILNNILQLEVYYLLGEKNVNVNFVSKREILTNKTSLARITFLYEGNTMENIISKYDIKKCYSTIKLYYKDLYINILVYKDELNNYDKNALLKKINDINYFRGVLRIIFGIKEYPLENFYLEEKEMNNENNEIDLDKIFILKNRNERYNSGSKMMSSNYKRSSFYVRSSNLNMNTMNNFSTNSYNDLNKDQKIKYLEKENIQLKARINKLEEKLKRYPIQLERGEKMMAIIFTSVKQDVHYSVICKNTDPFVNVEVKLYHDYPEYKRGENNYFTVNGRKISKYDSLEENGIKNNDIILLNQLE